MTKIHPPVDPRIWAALNPQNLESGVLELRLPPWRFRVFAESWERMAVAVVRMQWQTRSPGDMARNFARFAAWVDAWTQAVTLYTGPLAILEKEPTEGKILVRSRPPGEGFRPGDVYVEIWWLEDEEYRRAHWLHWRLDGDGGRRPATRVYTRTDLLRILIATRDLGLAAPARTLETAGT